MVNLSSIRLFFGPMSKNIVDSLIELSDELDINLGLIPSRRQVDFRGGYVNNWSTESLAKYVRSKSQNIVIERDHGGGGQGEEEDDGLGSFAMDALNLDLIHIDPWKKYKNYEQGLNKTVEYINFCSKISSKVLFEIGTEEALRPFTPDELNLLVLDLKNRLEFSVFNRIKYLVIQSGTALKEDKNIGHYDQDRLRGMIAVAQKHNLLSKEHNGDYLEPEQIAERLNIGLSAINIAPELGKMESESILEVLTPDEIDAFFEMCLESGKWKKWVPANFDPYQDKKHLIKITGHYLFSRQMIQNIYDKYDIKNSVKSKLKNKIANIYYYLR